MIRSTQRIPRSCTFCQRRKIKCDKQIPCYECRHRNRAAACHVEVVRVRGQVVRDGQLETQPSYADLLRENNRLRTQLQELAGPPGHLRLLANVQSDVPRMNMLDPAEQRLYTELRSQYRKSSVRTIDDIMFPSKECSRRILRCAKKFTWLCVTIDTDDLEKAIDRSWDRHSAEGDGIYLDDSWFGLYFALLTVTVMLMTEEETSSMGLAAGSQQTILENWYDASLLYLNSSAFLWIPSIRSAQTIALLGACFINFGDFNLYNHLWPVALRIVQGMADSSDSVNNAHDGDAYEKKRVELWWNLMIPDWLSFQLRPGCMSQQDSSMRLPVFPEDSGRYMDENGCIDIISSGHHHTAMVWLGYTLYRFQVLLSQLKQDADLEPIIKSADEELADIISNLPFHLQPEDEHDQEERSSTQPWIAWQKHSLSIMLLYYRLVVNRVARKYGPQGSVLSMRGHSVCRECAHLIVQIAMSHELDYSRQLIWSVLLPVYSAATVLVMDWSECQCGTTDAHLMEIMQCINWFEILSPRSVYAKFAAKALSDLVYEKGTVCTIDAR